MSTITKSVDTPSKIDSILDFAADLESVSFLMRWIVYDINYTHSLVIKDGESTILTFNDLVGLVGTHQKAIVLSSNERLTLLSAMKNKQNIRVTFILTTYNGSSVIGTSSYNNVKISTLSKRSSPNLGTFSIYDRNQKVSELTGSQMTYVQSLSDLDIIFKGATAKNGANIAEYRATIGTKTVTSKTPNIRFGKIQNSESTTLSVTVIDSRGYSVSTSVKVSILSYSSIKIDSWNIRRVNNTEETVQLALTGSISNLTINHSNCNDLTSARYRYAISPGGTYSSYQNISGISKNGSTFSFSDETFLILNSNHNYNIEIEVKDNFTTHSIILLLNKGEPLVSFRSEKVGINNPNPQAALDVNGNIMMNGYNVQGFIKKLDNDTDLNSIFIPGNYFASVASSSNLNYPSGEIGILEVLQVTSYFIMQRYTTVYGRVYIRSFYSSSWFSWTALS